MSSPASNGSVLTCPCPHCRYDIQIGEADRVETRELQREEGVERKYTVAADFGKLADRAPPVDYSNGR